MSDPKIRASQEWQLFNLLAEVNQAIIDAHTFLSHVEPIFGDQEMPDAMMVGQFLRNTGQRIITMAGEGDDMQSGLQAKTLEARQGGSS